MVKEKKPAVRIADRKFQKSEFVFAHYQRQDEVAPSGDIKGGVIYHHSWGTGYQSLIFEDHEAATKWWDAEVKRLSEKS